MYAKEIDISIMKAALQIFMFFFKFWPVRENLFWGFIYLKYPSKKIIKIRKELDKNITNILFAEEPCYSISAAQLRFLALSLTYFFVSLDYDLLYL